MTRDNFLKSFQEKRIYFFNQPLLHDRRFLFGLWMIIAIFGMLKLHRWDNNFLIFRGVFWHTLHNTSLYAAYPQEYTDINHYGPLFSLIIAPFAAIPEWLGMLGWLIFLVAWLFVTIRLSGLSHHQQVFIFWFCAETLTTAVFMQQFNIAIAAIIISSFFLIEREHDFWAAFFIMLGTLVKLYGIVGLAFFFFSKHKGKFILSLVFWAIVLFCVPMLISSPEYIITQHKEWIKCLIGKDTENIYSTKQNISLLGMIRRFSGNMSYSDLWLIIPALILFALPYLRKKQWGYLAFRETYLASVLLFVILFSTGSENSGYIIALTGACIWYTAAPWKRSHWDILLMVIVFLLSGMGNSDIWPKALRKGIVEPYTLRALPISILWLKLCWEMMTRKYVCPQKQSAEAES